MPLISPFFDGVHQGPNNVDHIFGLRHIYLYAPERRGSPPIIMDTLERNSVILIQPAGFCNRLNNIINGMYLKERINRPFYLYWPLMEPLRCGVDKLFVSPFPTISDEQHVHYYYREPLLRLGIDDDVMDALRQNEDRVIHLYTAVPLKFVSVADYRRLLRSITWSDPVKRQLAIDLAMHPIDGRLDGLHIRSTDFNAVLNRNEDRVMDIAVAAINKCANRVLLSSDDEVLKNKLQERFLDKLVVYRRPYDPSGERGSICAVSDLLLLARTRIRFYSPLSTYSRVAIAISTLVPDESYPDVMGSDWSVLSELRCTTASPLTGADRDALPPDFDWEEYLSINSDVGAVFSTEEGAIAHWLNHGLKEGRTHRRAIGRVRDPLQLKKVSYYI